MSDRVAASSAATVTVTEVPIPFDCVDGFVEAFYGRPEALLDPEVRARSRPGALPPACVDVAGAARRLDAGEWDARHGHLRTQPSYVGSLRLVVTES